MNLNIAIGNNPVQKLPVKFCLDLKLLHDVCYVHFFRPHRTKIAQFLSPFDIIYFSSCHITRHVILFMWILKYQLSFGRYSANWSRCKFFCQHTLVYFPFHSFRSGIRLVLLLESLIWCQNSIKGTHVWLASGVSDNMYVCKITLNMAACWRQPMAHTYLHKHVCSC